MDENNIVENIKINRINLFKSMYLNINNVNINNIQLNDDAIYFLTVFFSIFFKKTDKFVGAFDSEAVNRTRQKTINNNNQRDYIYLGTRSRTTGEYIITDALVPLNHQTRMLIKLLLLLVDFIEVQEEDRSRLVLYISRRYQYNALVQDAITGAVALEGATYAATALAGNFVGNPNNPYENVENIRGFYGYVGVHNVNVFNDILRQYNDVQNLRSTHVPQNLQNLNRSAQMVIGSTTQNFNNILETVGQRQLQTQLQIQNRQFNSNSTNIIEPNSNVSQNIAINDITNFFDNILENAYTDNNGVNNYLYILTGVNITRIASDYSDSDLITILQFIVNMYNNTPNYDDRSQLELSIDIIINILKNRSNKFKITKSINFQNNYPRITINVRDLELEEENRIKDLEEEENRIKALEEENKRRELEELELQLQRQSDIQEFERNVQEVIAQQIITHPERTYEQNLLAALLVARENLIKDYPNSDDISNAMNSILSNLNEKISDIANYVNNVAIQSLGPGLLQVSRSNGYGMKLSIVVGTMITVVLGSIISYFLYKATEEIPVDKRTIAKTVDNIELADKARKLSELYGSDINELSKIVREISDKVPDLEEGMATDFENSVWIIGRETFNIVLSIVTAQTLQILVSKVTNTASQITNNPYSGTSQLVAIVVTYFAYDALFKNDGKLTEVATAVLTTTSTVAGGVSAVAGGVSSVVGGVNNVTSATAGFINSISSGTVDVGNKITTISEQAGTNFIKYGGRLVLVVAGVSLAYIVYKYYATESESEKTYNLKIIKEK